MWGDESPGCKAGIPTETHRENDGCYDSMKVPSIGDLPNTPTCSAALAVDGEDILVLG